MSGGGMDGSRPARDRKVTPRPAPPPAEDLAEHSEASGATAAGHDEGAKELGPAPRCAT